MATPISHKSTTGKKEFLSTLSRASHKGKKGEKKRTSRPPYFNKTKDAERIDYYLKYKKRKKKKGERERVRTGKKGKRGGQGEKESSG